MTRIGGGNFSNPVRVTVVLGTTPTDNTTMPTPQQTLTGNNNALYALSVLPSLIVVSAAITVFSLLYYRR